MKTSYQKQIFILSFSFLLVFAFIKCTNSTKLHRELEKYADRENSTYPVEIDDVTRLDHCEALSSNTLQYSYTLSVDKALLDTTAIKDLLKQQFIHSIKTEPGSAFLRKNNVSFQYQFSDTANNYIFSIQVLPKDYK